VQPSILKLLTATLGKMSFGFLPAGKYNLHKFFHK